MVRSIGRVSRLIRLGTLLLLPIAACQSGSGPPTAQKLDQLAGVWLEYKASPGTDADVQLAFEQGLQALGVDLDTVLAAPPAATGIILTDELIEERPELAPYRDLIVRLYSYALWQLATEEPAPTPQPAAPSP